MNDMNGTEKIALVIIGSETTETIKGVPDSAEYVPCIVVEGKAGYYTTNWFWGKDPIRANVLAAEYNRNLGITPDEVNKLINQSVRLQIQEERSYYGNMMEITALAKKYRIDTVKFTKFWQMRFPDHGAMYLEDWARRLRNGTAKEQADNQTLRALKDSGLLD